jgi:hypothetical protein
MFENPDYPTNLQGSFLNHTYQAQSQPQSYFYNGNGLMAPNFQSDSRRNDQMNNVFATPQAPQMGAPQANNGVPNMAAFNALYQQPSAYAPAQPQVFANPGVNAMLNAYEPNVRPYSSYPPEYSQPQNPFATDSRRFDQTPQSNVPNNPWNTPAQNTFAPQNNNQMMPQMMPQYTPTMDCATMYGNYGVTPVSKKTQQWDTMGNYQYPQTTLPVADWSSYVAQNQPVQSAAQCPPMFPTGVAPQTSTSWTEMYEKNFKK